MVDAMAVDERGQVLRTIDLCAEPSSPGPLPGPCPLALVVLICEQAVLLGKNRWRHEWELPGGLIEDGETARQAACRELAEETGVELALTDLDWFGLASFELVEPARSERAAVFFATATRWPSVVASFELPDLAWCSVQAPLGPTSPLDLAIARVVVESLQSDCR